MKTILALTLSAAFVAGGAEFPKDPKFDEIVAKHRRQEKLTFEEEDYYQSTVEFRNQTQSVERNKDWAAANPARESTGLTSLAELGKGTYKGEQGGLYPNGENKLPADHLKAGLALAKKIVPLDTEGQPSADGKIVLLTIGMSNTHQESRSFLRIFNARKGEINPKVVAVDGAEGAKTAKITAQPNNDYWKIPAYRLRDAGVTPQQVQVVWLKQANAMPTAEFPIEVKKLEADVLATIHNLHDKYPNLKMLYLSTRIYAGYAAAPLNPEPHSYESGFAYKWLIGDQIAGKPELNYDPAKGTVRAPWIAWGPDLWSDGMAGRKSDSLIWKREDLAPDGTHPSPKGREKVAQMLFDFLEKSPTTAMWFGKR